MPTVVSKSPCLSRCRFLASAVFPATLLTVTTAMFTQGCVDPTPKPNVDTTTTTTTTSTSDFVTIGDKKFGSDSDLINKNTLDLPLSGGYSLSGYGDSAGHNMLLNYSPSSARSIRVTKVVQTTGSNQITTYLAKATDGAVYEIRREVGDSWSNHCEPVTVYPSSISVGQGWSSLAGYNLNTTDACTDQTENLTAIFTIVSLDDTSPSGFTHTIHLQEQDPGYTQTHDYYYQPGIGLVEEHHVQQAGGFAGGYKRN